MIEVDEPINERKVLKVKNNPDTDMGMPNAQQELPDQSDMNNPDFKDNDMNGGQDGANSDKDFDFDTNFDAGVESDEHEDPKKYIQQLTGKLSQKLRDYNKNQDDNDLNKYVAGMIVVQASKGLDQDSKDEIIDKINNSSSDNDSDNFDDDSNDEWNNDGVNDGDGNAMEDFDHDGEMKENRNHIDEVLNNMMDFDSNGKSKIPKNKSYHKMPFTNPSIK